MVYDQIWYLYDLKFEGRSDGWFVEHPFPLGRLGGQQVTIESAIKFEILKYDYFRFKLSFITEKFPHILKMFV